MIYLLSIVLGLFSVAVSFMGIMIVKLACFDGVSFWYEKVFALLVLLILVTLSAMGLIFSYRIWISGISL